MYLHALNNHNKKENYTQHQYKNVTQKYFNMIRGNTANFVTERVTECAINFHVSSLYCFSCCYFVIIVVKHHDDDVLGISLKLLYSMESPVWEAQNVKGMKYA